MLVLSIRTDRPRAEIGLFEDGHKIAYQTWEAHRQLAETIHLQITTILQTHGRALTDIKGLICFKGPGSFTGLRIGLTVANVLAMSLTVPVVGSGGGNWLEQGLQLLADGENDVVAMPEYGAEVHITKQRK